MKQPLLIKDINKIIRNYPNIINAYERGTLTIEEAIKTIIEEYHIEKMNQMERS